jgi:large subunit ribosomal protein L13
LQTLEIREEKIFNKLFKQKQVNTLSYKTVSANKNTVNKEWIVVDAEGEILGRLASNIAKVIRGKHKPTFTPHVDCGDNVIVINADKIKLTGKQIRRQSLRSLHWIPRWSTLCFSKRVNG